MPRKPQYETPSAALMAAVRDGDVRQNAAAAKLGMSKATFHNYFKKFLHEQAKMRSRPAIQECRRWITYCLEIGFPVSERWDLERLWWEWHDENGNRLSQPRHA